MTLNPAEQAVAVVEAFPDLEIARQVCLDNAESDADHFSFWIQAYFTLREVGNA